MLEQRHAVLDRRSYFAVLYQDGHLVGEWQPDVDWLHLTRHGWKELRLYCPNGQVAVLGGPDLHERCFQLKTATASTQLGQQTEAHLIGRLEHPGGACTLYAWEYGPGRLVGPLADNFHHMQYGAPATAHLSPAVLGVQV